MSTYYIRSSQTTVHPADPGFRDLEEARKELRACVDDDLKDAKRRWLRAVKIKLTDDAYAIHATKDRESALWRAWSISKV
jgi:hypothetical protein